MSNEEKNQTTDLDLSGEIVRGEIGQYQIDNDNDPRWGLIKPLRNSLGLELYESPQLAMFFGTFIMALVMEVVMLQFVFFKVHFYIGIVLCLFIIYLLFSLGFSDPGVAFVDYQRMQCHFDVEMCTEHCKHAATLREQFTRFCHKCNIPIRLNTMHCKMCNTCIADFDHHCVFIGKCVGRKNYGRFKLFLLLIFGTLIYGFISAMYSVDEIKKIKQL